MRRSPSADSDSATTDGRVGRGPRRGAQSTGAGRTSMATQPVKDSDPTIGRLVSDATRDISALINKEIQLAKSELKVSVKAGGTGVGLFAGAAFLVLLAIVMFSMALAYLIHWNGEGLDLQWAFL